MSKKRREQEIVRNMIMRITGTGQEEEKCSENVCDRRKLGKS